MSIVPVSDTTDRVTEICDRRLGHVLVVVSRACFPKILQFPGFLFPSLDVQFQLDAGKSTQLVKTFVRPAPAAKTYRRIWQGMLRHDFPDMRVNNTVHRPVEGLAGLYSLVEQPSPW